MQSNRVRYDELEEYLSGYAERTFPVLRVGLGAVILLAGAHKLVAPGVWTKYAAPWVTAVWPESLLPFALAMQINGAIEVGFGVALLAGVYTTVAAGIVAVSLLGVVVDLLAGAVLTGKYVDVLIRDIGLLTLAVGVTLLSARSEERAE